MTAALRDVSFTVAAPPRLAARAEEFCTFVLADPRLLVSRRSADALLFVKGSLRANREEARKRVHACQVTFTRLLHAQGRVALHSRGQGDYAPCTWESARNILLGY